MTPAVVVITYDRPHTLQRLLASLDAADYPAGVEVPLVISVDQGVSVGRRGVLELAKGFAWRFGEKRMIEQPERLGLVGHFWAAGGLSRNYGATILLEDDLSVAPPFYKFASQTLARYDGEERVGGVCLYDLWFNGFTGLPFRALDDGTDVYFAQLPYTQGYAFTASQWTRFETWSNANRVEANAALHAAFLRFREDEWLPVLASYLAREGRYFCFPRSAVSTGWGDAGVHFDSGTDWFLAPVQVRGGNYRLPDLDASLAVYDGFFEASGQRLRELAPALRDVAFDVDLNATKTRDNLSQEYVLTTRPARRALQRLGLRLQPLELNVSEAMPGDEISLARVEDVYWDRWAGLEARRRLETVAWAKRRPSRRRAVWFGAARVISWLRRLLIKEV
jgi:hypothetical protein